MSLPPDDEPTIVPVRAAPGGRSGPGAAWSGSGNALPFGMRLDEFEITGLVGEGGFGIVYQVYDHVLERKVAVKEYMPSALAARGDACTVVVRSARLEEPFQAGLRSFINEARLLARFDHPSLVKVHRFWNANGTAYMAMPLYEGITLKATLRAMAGPPDEAWLKDVLRPLLDALALLHDDHCYHRDIAPDNILMLDGARPLLLDFGAARRVIGDLTQNLTAILKPGYAPVEQYAEASMKQGAWTDIYALASVVYFAISGRPPDPSVARLIADPVVPLAASAAGRYSEQFLRGIDKALSVKPENRPQSIAELQSLLGLDTGHAARRPAPATAPAHADDVMVVAPARAAPAAAAARPASPVSAAAATAATREPVAGGARGRRTLPLVLVSVALSLVVAAGAYYLLVRPQAAPEPVEPVAEPPSAVGTRPANATSTPSPAATQPAPVPAAQPATLQPSPPALPSAEPALVQPALPGPARSTEPATAPVTKPAPERSSQAAPPRRPVAKPAASAGESSPAGKNAQQPAGAGPQSACVDILQRASLGEALTPAERATLKEHCR